LSYGDFGGKTRSTGDLHPGRLLKRTWLFSGQFPRLDRTCSFEGGSPTWTRTTTIRLTGGARAPQASRRPSPLPQNQTLKDLTASALSVPLRRNSSCKCQPFVYGKHAGWLKGNENGWRRKGHERKDRNGGSGGCGRR